MKTASTFLQARMYHNRHKLQHRGIHFPAQLAGGESHSTHGRVSHRPLMHVARNPGGLEPLRAQFAELNAAGHRKVVLTNEYLANMPVAAIERLRDLIDAPEIRIVYACRAWHDRLPSLWFQHIFENGTLPLPDYYVSQVCQKEFGPEIDYAQIWHNWAQVFGRANLVLFPYSVIKEKGGDIFERFCRQVLRTPPMIIPDHAQATVWASPGPKELEFVRAMNAYRMAVNPEHAAQRTNAMFWGWQKLAASRDLTPLFDMMESAMGTLVLDDEIRPLMAVHEKLRHYKDRVVGGGPVFKPGSNEVRFVRPDYLLRPGAAEMIRDCAEEIMRG